MDDLFADEQPLPRCSENMVLTDSQSYEDPVLIKDRRVLANILRRQSQEAEVKEDYFQTVQTELKPHMRKIVSDWMLEVCEEQRCQPEVFSLAVDYLDRFLAVVPIKKSQFQLLACVCMFLASKFKETAPLPADNLVVYTDNSVSAYEITVSLTVFFSSLRTCILLCFILLQQWELIVLQVLGWELSSVTPYSILDQLLRTLAWSPAIDLSLVRKHAETFVALAATEFTFYQQSPAVVAVASLGAALRGLHVKGLDEVLKKLQGVTGVDQVNESKCRNICLQHAMKQPCLLGGKSSGQVGNLLLLNSLQNAITNCMEQIEVSIRLSMSGASFQPSDDNNAMMTTASTVVATPLPSTVVAAPLPSTQPKVIPQQPACYGHTQSNTPTDLMEISSMCVY